MLSEQPKEIDRAELKRKNRNVVVALICGFGLPSLYAGLLSRYLPSWLNILVVGGIFWV